MTIEERAETAMDLKKNHGYNCCQAVTAVLADQTELAPEQINQISSGFAVGMGNMEATCGSLIGAAMVAGMSTQGKGSVGCARKISENFQKRSGATVCKDLKGRDTGVVLCPCDSCVKNAVLAYGDIMNLK